jgi:hypothetical protein
VRALGETGRGAIRQYLIKLKCLSRTHIARLVQHWGETRQVRRMPPNRPSFRRRYIAWLVQLDAAHKNLSGPAIRRILQREYSAHEKPEFEGRRDCRFRRVFPHTRPSQFEMILPTVNRGME